MHKTSLEIILTFTWQYIFSNELRIISKRVAGGICFLATVIPAISVCTVLYCSNYNQNLLFQLLTLLLSCVFCVKLVYLGCIENKVTSYEKSRWLYSTNSQTQSHFTKKNSLGIHMKRETSGSEATMPLISSQHIKSRAFVWIGTLEKKKWIWSQPGASESVWIATFDIMEEHLFIESDHWRTSRPLQKKLSVEITLKDVCASIDWPSWKEICIIFTEHLIFS